MAKYRGTTKSERAMFRERGLSELGMVVCGGNKKHLAKARARARKLGASAAQIKRAIRSARRHCRAWGLEG